jgi:hypothetical protein
MKKEMVVHSGRLPNSNSAKLSNRDIDLFTIILLALPCIMVKTSKSEQQAALASTMELYLATSVAVQEDPDLEDDSDMEDDGLIIDEGGDTEIFEALGFQAMQDGQEILGDG